MLEELVKLANRLDDKGHRKEADLLDKIIRKAMDESDDELSAKILDELTLVSLKTGYGRIVARVIHYLHPEQPIFVELYFGGENQYVVSDSWGDEGYTGDSFDNAVAVNKRGEKVPEKYLKYVEFAKPLLNEKSVELQAVIDSSPMAPRFHWAHLFSGSKEYNKKMDDHFYESLKKDDKQGE